MKVRLLPERGLDVAEAHVAGRQIAWLSGLGDVPWNGDWRSSWGGGLVTTCGLDNVGAASEGIGLHGTYSSLPARGLVHENGAVRAQLDDPRGLHVQRRIAFGSGGLTVTDRVTNRSSTMLETPLLYHVNFGDWAERVESGATRVIPRDSDAAPHDPSRMPDRGEEPERVWEHCFSKHQSGTWARVRGAGVEVTVRSSLPRLWQWIEPSLGALGIEPANCSVLGRAHDRSEGRLPVLAPGESRETWLSITAKETTR